MSIVPSPPANATPTARGLMSAADKSKLDGLSASPVSAVTQANGLTLTTGTLAMGAASDAAAGAVTTGTQTFAGTKTFGSLVATVLATLTETVTSLVRAVGASLVLRSSLGAGASDVAVKVGTSETDAGTNASAKLLSVRTGLGGTEVEHAWVRKNGYFHADGKFRGASASSGYVEVNDVAGVRLIYGTGAEIACVTNNVSVAAISLVTMRSVETGAAAICTRTGSNGAAADENTLSAFGINLLSAPDYRARLRASGRLDQSGTDSSGTPGAATISKPTGKSAIANGATTVRITNSLVAAGDQVHVTWHGDHGQTRWWVTTGAGYFDVTLNAAATADTAFCWTVSKRL